MKEFTHISILNKGYYSHTFLWSQLYLINIDSTTHFDNGFVTCIVKTEDADKVTAFVREYLGERLITVESKETADQATLYRKEYWENAEQLIS